jgi:hypothetical protein
MRARWSLICALGALFTATGFAQRVTPPSAGQKPSVERPTEN